MAIDVAEMLFREVLGFTSYPGSPFTGNIFQDIILFFFVPTVFLIIFVYIASAIAVPPESGKLRMLMGLAIYAFIVAGRYFESFAIFSSQFYIPFIILIALFYFFARHFRRGGQAPGGALQYRGGEGNYSQSGGGEGGFTDRFNPRLQSEFKRLDQSIEKKEKERDHYLEKGQRVPDPLAQSLEQLRSRREEVYLRLHPEKRFL